MSSHTIPTDVDPTNPIIIVTLSNIIKLTSSNYTSWKLEFEATLDGYGLFKYLDGTFTAPSKTIVKDNVPTTNAAYLTWVRQDQLLFGALIGTLDQNIVPLVLLTTTTKEIWDTLADTFASTSRGHLALLGAKVDQGVIDAVNARDKPISFSELHENLIKRELTIKNQPILELSWDLPSPFITYRSHPPQAHVATATSPQSAQWLPDSGASHHVTHDLMNLSLHHPYSGTEEIAIGDGSTHGDTSPHGTN
nr:hypothetical protein [Tanacetum cinerariifolium]